MTFLAFLVGQEPFVLCFSNGINDLKILMSFFDWLEDRYSHICCF